ncbi:LysE family translocator [Pararhodobacter zhoushanensis]|uniref:LysE family translocator n=1 Tax=Pararhodobacter zhoushanensis TaxID=2479545 RepID=A0ABT3GY40_9RHOB|nr:LysE family translocator [Pararhodobacter zhoushanensis]MCW1932474.1 LysE family translocator [Pararhodobacter zhoushanensis]
MTLAAFLAFAGLSLFAAVSPGPAVLMSARTGLTEGFRTGALMALGIAAGAVFWASAAMFGLNLLFAVAPALLWALKLGGAAYLGWLGWLMWRDARQPLVMGDDRPVPRSGAAAFRLGLFTQLANPKPAVMFSAMFLGTVPPQTPAWVYAALLAVVFLNESLWNMAVARLFSLDRTRTRYISLKTMIDRGFGALLALLGVKIAAT